MKAITREVVGRRTRIDLGPMANLAYTTARIETLAHVLDKVAEMPPWAPNVDGRSMVSDEDGEWLEYGAVVELITRMLRAETGGTD